MANIFDNAWAAMSDTRMDVMSEPAYLDGTAVSVVVLRLLKDERIGEGGGRSADVDGMVEMSRAQWAAARGKADSALRLRGWNYRIRNEPTDSPDSSTVVLELINGYAG